MARSTFDFCHYAICSIQQHPPQATDDTASSLKCAWHGSELLVERQEGGKLKSTSDTTCTRHKGQAGGAAI